VYHVKLFWDLDMDTYHASKVVTGLVELSRRKAIVLDWRVAFSKAETQRPDGESLVWLEVEKVSDGKKLKVAIDLHDMSTLFYERALQACDVYLKRSFYPPDIEKYAATEGYKVIPFGFNFACSSPASKRLVRGWLLRLYLPMFFHSPREAMREAPQQHQFSSVDE
jgi:hypothetical protein